MPRKRRIPTEAHKKRVRSFRNRERRLKRKQKSQEPADLSWLLRSDVRMAAAKILNEHGSHTLPYRLSIPHEADDGNPPVASFYPCSIVRTKRRTYYSFMFREHRDRQCELWADAFKELTLD